MNNKILITVIVLLLGSVLINGFIPFGVRTSMFIAISIYLSLFVMLINGTFVTKRYAALAWIAVGLYLLGFIFKIMHLTGADQLLMISFPLLFVVYTIHFFSKPTKKLLDYLKMLTLLSMTYDPLDMLHLLSYETGYILKTLHMTIVGITFAVFLVALWREQKASDEGHESTS